MEQVGQGEHAAVLLIGCHVRHVGCDHLHRVVPAQLNGLHLGAKLGVIEDIQREIAVGQRGQLLRHRGQGRGLGVGLCGAVGDNPGDFLRGGHGGVEISRRVAGAVAHAEAGDILSGYRSRSSLAASAVPGGAGGRIVSGAVIAGLLCAQARVAGGKAQAQSQRQHHGKHLFHT